MIYTIGNKEEYDKCIAEKEAKGERLLKRGRRQVGGKELRGGAAFRTVEAAQAWIDGNRGTIPEAMGWAVYGLEANWERDTKQYEKEPFARLIVDRPLVKLV